VTYSAFLASKSTSCPAVGFDPKRFTAPLFPFQRDIVTMACRVGRFCIWADCGMGKTAMQLEWAHQVHQHTGGNVLVLAPLAVAHQTVREGSKFDIPCAFAATQADVHPGITVTNYEKLSHFDPATFDGVVLDESSILKADAIPPGLLSHASAQRPHGAGQPCRVHRRDDPHRNAGDVLRP
jgi:superfamily II DNA or RNA helicase